MFKIPFKIFSFLSASGSLARAHLPGAEVEKRGALGAEEPVRKIDGISADILLAILVD